MKEELVIRLKKLLSDHEGNYNHMYCDSLGKVTIGIGHLLPTIEAAIKLPLMVDGRKASNQEIKEEYDKIKELGRDHKNYKASWYGKKTSLHLEDKDVTEIFKEDVEKIEASLIYYLKDIKDIDYNEYPDDVKLVLFDMAYNLGVHGLIIKFPTFLQAIRDRDYKIAAEESHRLDVSDKRNEFTRELLL